MVHLVFNMYIITIINTIIINIIIINIKSSMSGHRSRYAAQDKMNKKFDTPFSPSYPRTFFYSLCQRILDESL